MNWNIILYIGVLFIAGMSTVVGTSLDSSAAHSGGSEWLGYEMVFPDDTIQEILISVTPESINEQIKTSAPENNDVNSSFDDATATKIKLDGSSASIEGSGAAVSEGIISISVAGTYVVSGTLTNGQIVVDAPNEDLVHLVLNGVDITNKAGAAMYAPQCDKLILTLADGTKNTVTDGGDDFVYTLVDDEEPNAAIFAKNDLTINGRGTLTVNAGFHNGISTKDDLLIISGDIIINAANNGLVGKDSVDIMSGTFSISAGNDGIQTNNSKNQKKGWIRIEDGTFDITAANDGIQAESNLTITGGVFQITTGGGSANAPVRLGGHGGFGGGMEMDGRFRGQMPEGMPEGDWFGGFGDRMGMNGSPRGQMPEGMPEGDWFGGFGDRRGMDGGFRGQMPEGVPGGDWFGGFRPEQQSQTTTQEESASMKALKAKTLITITGGDFTLDAEDDGVHSNGDIFITGGNLFIKTGDDAIHAENDVTITDGEINIPTCYEGIEGMTVTISGGNITIIANDDGINASDGTGFGAMGRGRGGFVANENLFIRITGGTIDISTPIDGFDSNGNVFIEGGTLKISASSMGMDGAIDMDGRFTLTGGELITAGSSPSPTMATQPVILVSYTYQLASGSLIAIKDSDGNTLLEYTSKIACSLSAFTSPSFVVGETYSLFINGEKRIDIITSDMITTMGDDGGDYYGGRWPGMDDWRDFRFFP